MAKDWNFARDAFPSLPPDPTYDQVLAAARATLGPELEDLFTQHSSWLAEKEALEMPVAIANAYIAAAEMLILAKLTDLGVDTVRSQATGVTYSIDRTVDAKILDRGLVRRWLEANAMADLLQPNGQTLSALVRERIDEGLDLPDGIEIVPRNAVRRRAPARAKR